MTLPKASVFIAVSVDGFIAREDGGLDWLDQANEANPPGEDCGYGAFMRTIDTLVMGRLTFETVRDFRPWPYEGKRVVVLATKPVSIPPELSSSVFTLAGTPAEILSTLGGQGAKHVYVDGGETIRRFLWAGLVGRMILTRIPVLLGRGRPLFGAVPEDIWLKRVESRAYPNGYTQDCYEVLS
ncbi:MAG: dihydrofolate reductase family protein [Deltaproteobacteria bacterium]|nr:dihydrofolate reductase family protein [Deltaproteobacteria bacterium]